MMNCLLMAILLCTIQTFAQEKQVKPPIDTCAFKNWPSVHSPAITKNGKYVIYAVENQPVGKRTVVVASTNGKWGTTIVTESKSEHKFTVNDKFCLIKSGDTIKILLLGTNEIKVYPGIRSYQNCINNSNQWLAYTLTNSPKSLQLINFDNEQVESFENIKNYQFSSNGNSLLFQIDNDSLTSLHLYELKTGIDKCIWEGSNLGEVIWHSVKDQLVFLLKENTDSVSNYALFEYKTGYEKVLKIADNVNWIKGFEIRNVLGISMDGERAFLSYSEINARMILAPQPRSVNIWSYRDGLLNAEKRGEKSLEELTYSFSLKDKTYMKLQSGTESIKLFLGNVNDTIAIVTSGEGRELLSTLNGNRRATDISLSDISPGGKFIIGEDINHNMIAYCIANGTISDISKGLLDGDQKIQGQGSIGEVRNLRLIAWLPEDSAILISDAYDIWKVYPTGEKKPVSITNGYGFKNHIPFEISGHQIWDFVFRDKDNMMILKAKNLINKQSGYFSADIRKTEDPFILTMGAYSYGGFAFNFGRFGQNWSASTQPEKFVIFRESARESPNCFITSDFVHFKPVSNVYPEKKYNWLTTELIKFTTLDSVQSNAILYKPTNFDAKSKYPVIFYYYEDFSQKLNEYIMPEPCNGGINIPWFVSHGYVVCVPDIHNNQGNPGKSAYNAVLGIYNVLKTRPWIDSSKAAIGGHSFGGFETNYIVAHSNVFKAAYSGSGISDLISFYASVMEDGTSRSVISEVGQIQMNSTIWEKKDLYIDNSAVFNADKVTTPLLLMSNRGDKLVPFNQAAEFFSSLRRLGKKTWLLEYVNEEHTIEDKNAQLDFTFRLTEYYSHYLKGTPAPEWMQ